MSSDPLDERTHKHRPSCWIAIVAITAVISARPAFAFDSTSKPVLAERQPTSIEVFRDEFFGAGLAPHWSVDHADTAAFSVTNGALRVESRAAAGKSGDGPVNLFRLNQPMPAGDWVVTAELTFRFDTGAENFHFTFWDDEDRWFGAQIRSMPNKYTGHRLMLAAVEGHDGHVFSLERPLVAIECNVCESAWLWQGFSQKLIEGQVLRLRIDKRGSHYAVSGMLGADSGAEWVEIEAVESTKTPRRLAFGLTQSRLPDIRQGAVQGGSSNATIDWIAIEVPRKSELTSEGRSEVAQSVPTR